MKGSTVRRLGASRMACLGMAAVLMSTGSAQAALIEHSASSLGGSAWRYDYRVVNSGPALSFDEFTVYVDAPGISNLSVLASPAGWATVVVQPDPLLPDVGYFDAVNTSGPVAAGATITGFSVSFSAQPGFVPGAQRFEFVQSAPFAIVQSGMTRASVSQVPLSVPPLLLAASLGLAGVIVRRRGAFERSYS
jgi:hypothetical protein